MTGTRIISFCRSLCKRIAAFLGIAPKPTASTLLLPAPQIAGLLPAPSAASYFIWRTAQREQRIRELRRQRVAAYARGHQRTSTGPAIGLPAIMGRVPADNPVFGRTGNDLTRRVQDSAREMGISLDGNYRADTFRARFAAWEAQHKAAVRS